MTAARADDRPLGDGYKWTALANTTAAVFMSTLDGSIVLIAMPAIFRGIHLDPLAPENIVFLLRMIMGYRLVQAVLVVTGKNLRMVTPRDQVTARDSLEWYDRKQLGVARGNALAVRDDRRVRGDILTSTMLKAANGPAHISRIDMVVRLRKKR